MKRHWLPVIIGYIVGSFFGLGQLLGLFSGMKARPASVSG